MINSRRFFTATILLLTSFFGSNNMVEHVDPPVARVMARVDTMHGDEGRE